MLKLQKINKYKILFISIFTLIMSFFGYITYLLIKKYNFLSFFYDNIILTYLLIFSLIHLSKKIIKLGNILKWKLLPKKAPLIVQNRSKKNEIIINCKNNEIAKKYISSPVTLNLIGLEGLAYFAKKDNEKIRNLLINFLEKTDYNEVKKNVTDVSAFEEQIINSIECIKV